MNIYILLSQFWRNTEGEGVSATEAALFSYLLYLANMNRWKMPFACSTSVLAQRLHTTKQSVVRAREALKEKDVIDYKAGKGKDDYPKYSIKLHLSDGMSDSVSDGLPDSVSERLSESLTLINIKDKDKISSSPSTRTDKKSIEELEKAFSVDVEWLTNIVTALHSPAIRSVSDVIDFLHRFFDSERAKGIKEREENDCKSHFFNWLKIQVKNLKTKNYDSEKHADPRRGVEATPRTAQNDDRPF